ncbi:hypothetical protein [Niastella populi]|uniref:BioF2-like acetyltransferase domain-containing protein n=1 Tax=Niastella populi TaxID=550983 RepID=A0A1V9FM44_9BACT|nr:hypothetical protein [Niastella populi]OQP59361.1 hypothetical protein A4R26_21320 [Niastella populi]
MHRNLQYLQRKHIDTQQWDRCIANAANGLLYAHSFYLDYMAGNWDALVLGDYEAVMPLTWRKKWGIRYVYRPAFIQQLGIFTGTELTVELVNRFLNELPAHFRFADFFLNYAHPQTGLPGHSNFLLPLQLSYEQLRANYKHDLVKNLKRTSRFNLLYSKENTYKESLAAFRDLYGNRIAHVTDDDYSRFEKVLAYLNERNNLVARSVTEDGKLLSKGMLLRDKHRLYLIASVTWPEGRNKGANHFLIDRLIDEFAGSSLVLDFEGSDIPGIAHFYKNFGSFDQPYYHFYYNKLPWPVRLLK